MKKEKILDAIRNYDEWTLEDAIEIERLGKLIRRSTARKGRESVPLGPRDAHTEHCCLTHGCKYGDPDCPVATGANRQSGDCEQCGLEDEGYFDT